jgi:hypothetical protein
MKLSKRNLTHTTKKVGHPYSDGQQLQGLQIQIDIYTYVTNKKDVHVIGVNTVVSDNMILHSDLVRKSIPLVAYYVNEVQWNHPSDVHLAIAKTIPTLKDLVLTEREEQKKFETEVYDGE